MKMLNHLIVMNVSISFLKIVLILIGLFEYKIFTFFFKDLTFLERKVIKRTLTKKSLCEITQRFFVKFFWFFFSKKRTILKIAPKITYHKRIEKREY